MNNNIDYNKLSKEELIQICEDKDHIMETYMNSFSDNKILNKEDIMSLYKCESNKALRILKLLFQMGYGNKIGKEYYVSQKSHQSFIECMAGKEVFI